MNKSVVGFLITVLLFSYKSVGFDGSNVVSIKDDSKETTTLMRFLKVDDQVIVGYEHNRAQWGAITSIQTKKSKEILEILVSQGDTLATLLIAPYQAVEVWCSDNEHPTSKQMNGQTIDVGNQVMLDGTLGIITSITHKKLIYAEEDVYVIATAKGAIEVSGVMCSVIAHE